MRILLERALFAPQTADEAVALALLLGDLARDSAHPHALLTDPVYVPGGDNGPIEEWLAQRPLEAASLRIVLESGLLRARSTLSVPASDGQRPRRWHLPGSLDIRVERRPSSDWRARRLTVQDAVDLMREPVHLVLENGRTDLAFLALLAGPTNGPDLQRRLDAPGRIATHVGGSGEAKKHLEELRDAPLTTTIWRRLLRTWVLFDKDSGNQDIRDPSVATVQLMDLCESIVSRLGEGLSWICLLRREIESYAPDRALREEALAAQQAFALRVESLRATPQHQDLAWALDLKKGLRGDLSPNLLEQVRRDLKSRSIPLTSAMLKAPLGSLPPADIAVLDGGMGDRLSEGFRARPARTWAAELPSEYDRGPKDQAPRVSLVQSVFDRM